MDKSCGYLAFYWVDRFWFMGMAEVFLWEEFITFYSISPLDPHSIPEVVCSPWRLVPGPHQGSFSRASTLYLPQAVGTAIVENMKVMGCLCSAYFQFTPPPPVFSTGTNECNQKSSWNSAERMMLAFHCYSLDRHMGFTFSVLSSIWLLQCFVTWESQLFSGFVIYNSFVIYNNRFVIYKSVLLFFISF